MRAAALALSAGVRRSPAGIATRERQQANSGRCSPRPTGHRSARRHRRRFGYGQRHGWREQRGALCRRRFRGRHTCRAADVVDAVHINWAATVPAATPFRSSPIAPMARPATQRSSRSAWARWSRAAAPRFGRCLGRTTFPPGSTPKPSRRPRRSSSPRATTRATGVPTIRRPRRRLRRQHCHPHRRPSRHHIPPGGLAADDTALSRI